MAQGYDDERFFAAYAEMPRSRHGLRAAGEWRQLRPLFPPLRGRRVLDLGCGYGWHCRFAAEQGAARVRAHLARYDRLTGGQRKANSELRAGGLQLNTVTRRVFAEGREVVLKNREYELLHFLMLHPDMVFSREELYEKTGGWRPWATTPPQPSTSTASGKKLSWIPAIPGISRPCGVRATGSRANNREEGKWKCGSYLLSDLRFLQA